MKISYLLSESFKPEDLALYPTLKPFSPELLSFIEQLSLALIRSPIVRSHAELTALAFWMRKANLEKLKKQMQSRTDNAILVPRGTVFHIAPSNVDSIFIYSWLLSLLVGNRNIVRLSSKDSIQTTILVQTVSELISKPEHLIIKQRNIFIQYTANDNITTELSSLCAARIIWGGDTTVNHIRHIPIPPTAIDIAFANKYSLSIIHSQIWTQSTIQQQQQWVELFYNDAYWFDQMACSSPRLILWVGTKQDAQIASGNFWKSLSQTIRQKHERFADADYVNKLVTTHNLAISTEAHIQPNENNDLVRVWLEKPALHIEQHCGAGLFLESAIDTLDELIPLLTRSVQTVAYAGFTKEELSWFVTNNALAGIDRLVPFGKALDFNYVWDGFDLLRTFTREITIS